MPNGPHLKGEWYMDKLEGFGIEIMRNGASYEGNFQNSLKNGQGTFKREDESIYTGQFCKDQIEGFGECVWADGNTFNGHWKQNILHGHGKFSWIDGRVYIGMYENN